MPVCRQISNLFSLALMSELKWLYLMLIRVLMIDMKTSDIYEDLYFDLYSFSCSFFLWIVFAHIKRKLNQETQNLSIWRPILKAITTSCSIKLISIILKCLDKNVFYITHTHTQPCVCMHTYRVGPASLRILYPWFQPNVDWKYLRKKKGTLLLTCTV